MYKDITEFLYLQKLFTQLSSDPLRRLLTILFFSSVIGVSAQTDTLVLNYFSHSPLAYNEAGIVKGIEVDIMNEFMLWLKAKKKINIAFRYNEYPDFAAFYAATKSAPKNTIGLGSAIVSAERMKEVDFSTPYCKNVAFLVTNGNAPDIKSKNSEEVVRALGAMTGLTLQNTTLNKYLSELKRLYVHDLKIHYRENETKILDDIAKNVLAFGYVDAINFWFYVKNNPHTFLKMQRVLSQSKEQMAFVLPKGSPYRTLFNEFFAGPGGFKNSPTYRAVLERYLGSYMTQNVAVN